MGQICVHRTRHIIIWFYPCYTHQTGTVCLVLLVVVFTVVLLLLRSHCVSVALLSVNYRDLVLVVWRLLNRAGVRACFRIWWV